VAAARNGVVPDSRTLLKAAARLPEHVVYRGFVSETVVLNLRTGKYHGLNPTGGQMLEALEREETVHAAVLWLAGEYGADVSQIEEDVSAFCRDLLDRGLIELHPNGRH
jgi:hypothetical protein